MTLGEKLKSHRENNGLSQEKVGEMIGVSRQAVTKWESSQTTPSSENLIALSSLYHVSLDDLVENKNKEQGKDKKILQSNLTLIAIILQAAFLNVAIQMSQLTESPSLKMFDLAFKFIPLFAASVWMAFNLRYEKNHVQYRKNTKIELLYCLIQICVALFAYYTHMSFLGVVLIITVLLIYLLIINPKYMNRQLTRKKESNEAV